jgi:Flp pilus assembly protein TadG
MNTTSFVRRLRQSLRDFRAANGANVAITFALACIPLFGMVGAAVDYSRVNSIKASLQSALDAAAIMLSKEAVTLTEAQINAKAQEYFMAQFTPTDVTTPVVTATYTVGSGAQLVLSAKASYKTNFTSLIGVPLLDVGASTTAKWGNKRLRVALVLDNTGSMSSDGKMAALKPATKSLLDQLKNVVASDGDVYVSIIPFVRDVNANSSNYNASWIDWTAWLDEPPFIKTNKPSNWEQIRAGSSCPFSNNSHGFRCTTGPANGASNTNNIPSSGSYAGYICPSKDNGDKIARQNDIYYNGCYNSVQNSRQISSGAGASCGGAVNCSCSGSGSGTVCTQIYYNHTWIPNAKSTWNGCVNDRGASGAPSVGNYDTNVVAPDSTIPATQFAAEQYDSCPQPVMPLNYDWAAMKTLVDNMSPDGTTNQGVGLAHGWMSLVGGGPYPAPPPEDPNYKYSKVIILMSDGLNTANRWYNCPASGPCPTIDARQKLTCDNVNAAGITLYTIHVNTGGDPTSALLQSCAGTPASPGIPAKYPDPNKFYLLTSANQMATVFQQIASEIANLRLAK